jgi:hypothetical protein
MIFTRIGLAVVLALLAGASPALAQSQPGPAFLSNNARPGRDRGVVRGEISGVDFGHGRIEVVLPNRQRIVVDVPPSTAIFQGRKTLGISDLRAGMTVEISLSEVEGRLVAQIIRVH